MSLQRLRPSLLPLRHVEQASTAARVVGIPRFGFALRALGGAWMIAAASQITVRLAATPVPFTLQSMAVLVVAALLGRGASTSAVVTYLAMGAAGLPVFAHAGSGLPHLLGPTGGYLLSYVPVAAWVGWAQSRGPVVRLLSWSGAVLFTLLAGVAVLSPWVGLRAAWYAGCVAFLPVDVCKAVAAWLLVCGLQRLRRI